MNIPKWLIIHHEAPPVITDKPRFQIVNEYHKQKFGLKSSLEYYCGYHFFIEKDGMTIQARLDGDEGAHTIGKNNESIGVCLAGNFDIEMPTKQQIVSLKNLLKEKQLQYNIPFQNIVPHRMFSAKSCYGLNLADDWARNLILDTQLSFLQRMLDEIKRKVALLLNKKNT